MKYLLAFIITLFTVSTIKAGTQDNAVLKHSLPIYDSDLDSRIELINDHAFLVFDLSKIGIQIAYGDKVEFKFGFGKTITVYNLSGGNSELYPNKKEMVAFIEPDYLRCFKYKDLKKIIIYSAGKRVALKTNISADQIGIN